MLARRLNQQGDTIVEVLIAIAIVSFILVAAYVTANKNTLINQDTQERGQAMQLVTTQLEFLHNKSVGTNNCFDVNGNPVGTAADNTPCMVNADGTKDVSHAQPEFTLAITHGVGTKYKVKITWASLLTDHTNDNITMYYQP